MPEPSNMPSGAPKVTLQATETGITALAFADITRALMAAKT